MKNIQIKLMVIAGVILALAVTFNASRDYIAVTASDNDAAADVNQSDTGANPSATPSAAIVKLYKTKCVACHTAKATKAFDPAKGDDVHIEVILKGKKAAKPPHMPGFEKQGVTSEKAKELTDYMKSLRSAAGS